MIAYILTLDERILLFIQEHIRNEFLTPVFKFFTTLGDAGMIWIVMILVLLLMKKYRRAGFIALISLALCFIINNMFLKNVVARPRPFDALQDLQVLIKRPTDFSFPSGHSANSFATAGAIFFMGNRKIGIGALMLASVIACSRMYLGVHYPSDVLAGIILGLIVGFIVVRVMKYRTGENIL